jgi:uncharacterized cupredoxin-like copper-binding protein
MSIRISSMISTFAVSAALVLSGCAAGPAASTATPPRASALPTRAATPVAATPVAATPTAAMSATTVDVTLVEFSVGTSVVSAPAGDVTFQVSNEGPEDQHEFVIIRTDLAPGDLPTNDNGSVDEEGEGIEVIDEVEELDVGDSEELSVPLEPGAYVLICNIFDQEENEAHYQEGMHTPFTVE